MRSFSASTTKIVPFDDTETSRGRRNWFTPRPGPPTRQICTPAGVYLAIWLLPVSAITMLPSAATSRPEE